MRAQLNLRGAGFQAHGLTPGTQPAREVKRGFLTSGIWIRASKEQRLRVCALLKVGTGKKAEGEIARITSV